jgi:hypothetical protein
MIGYKNSESKNGEKGIIYVSLEENGVFCIIKFNQLFYFFGKIIF